MQTVEVPHAFRLMLLCEAQAKFAMPCELSRPCSLHACLRDHRAAGLRGKSVEGSQGCRLAVAKALRDHGAAGLQWQKR
eukprot:1157768-Pelagomonas_calceolata.AAC.2